MSAICAFALLMGCGDNEVILPGERFDVRPQDITENQALPISLPAAKANAAWTHRSGTAQHKVTHPALSATPQLLFSASVGEGDSLRARITADPVVDNGVVYTLDARATVTATGTNGATIWSQNLTPGSDGANDASGGGIAVSDGRVFVTTGFGEVIMLDAATGGEIWAQDLDAPGASAPTVFGDLAYIVGRDGTGWALEVENGRIRWQVFATPAVGAFAGGAGAAVNDQLAIFPFPSGEVIATFRQGGLRRWSTVVSGARLGTASARITDIAGDPVIDGDRVYAGNFAGQIVALDISNGERLWTARDGAISPVWPAGNSLFAINDINELVRLSKSDGSAIWRVQLPGLVERRRGFLRQSNEVVAHYGPVLAGGRLIVASSDGVIRQFDPISGSVVGSFEIPGGAASNPIVAGQTLYVVGKTGQLHAFR
ncbi:MAG: PQQ-binding-like beta-propeller repeat protein [Pseudomonadota bacterium]